MGGDRVSDGVSDRRHVGQTAAILLAALPLAQGVVDGVHQMRLPNSQIACATMTTVMSDARPNAIQPTTFGICALWPIGTS